MAEPWRRWLVTGLWGWRSGFDPRSVHMRFVMDSPPPLRIIP